MKNFLGRIIILISSIVNCVLFFVILGVFLFYCINETPSIESFFGGFSMPLEYVGIVIATIDFIFFAVLTVMCLVEITNGKRMKNTFIISSVFFFFNLFTFLFNIFIPHTDTIYTGIMIGVTVAMIVTSLCFVLGSGLNYHKDCR